MKLLMIHLKKKEKNENDDSLIEKTQRSNIDK